MTIVQNKKGYDKILTLMALDMSFEDETGERFIDNEWFDKALVKVGFNKSFFEGKMDEFHSFYTNRLIEIMKKMQEEIEG